MSKKSSHEVDLDAVVEEQSAETGYQPALRSGNMSLDLQSNQEIDMAGLRTPRIKLAHGVGNLAGLGYNPGSVVYNDEVLLAEKEQPLNIIIVKFEQYLKEYLDRSAFDAKVRPKEFPDAKAARAAGMTTEWVNGKGPDVSPAMDALLLIERPEGLEHQDFGIEANGKLYAAALFTVDKTAYKFFGRTLLPAARYMLPKKYGNLLSASWTMTTVYYKNPKSGNGVWVPQLKLTKYNTEEEVNELMLAFGIAEPAEIK